MMQVNNQEDLVVGGNGNAQVDDNENEPDHGDNVRSEVDSSSDSEEESADESYHETFDRDIMHGLERNSSNVVCVEMCLGEDGDKDYRNINWGERGVALADNTNLEVLDVEGETVDRNDDGSAWQNGIAFYRALAGNRSITQLRLHDCLTDVGSMLEIMIPFFEGNENLDSFEVSQFCMCPESNELFSEALSKCNNLRSLKLHFAMGVDSSRATKLIDELAKHQNMEKLNLSLNCIKDNQWCVALASLLQNPLSNLVELNLEYGGINDIGIALIGSGLVNNKMLTKILLEQNYEITAPGWATLSVCLERSNIPLRELDLRHNHMTDEGLHALADGLVSIDTLKVLGLADNALVTPAGWNVFFDSLGSSNLELEDLHVARNNFGEREMISLASWLVNLTSLKTFDARWTEGAIGTDGRRALISLLRSPNLSVECLRFSLAVFDDETVYDCANALINNTTLETLDIDCDVSQSRARLTEGSLSYLARVLCNKSSVDSIFDSNYKLRFLNWTRGIHNELETYLTLNQNNYKREYNKFEIARNKILLFHFISGNKNMHDILSMEQNVLPFVISWAGKDVSKQNALLPFRMVRASLSIAGLSLLYRTLQGMPSLFDFSSKAKALGEKRKR